MSTNPPSLPFLTHSQIAPIVSLALPMEIAHGISHAQKAVANYPFVLAKESLEGLANPISIANQINDAYSALVAIESNPNQ